MDTIEIRSDLRIRIRSTEATRASVAIIEMLVTAEQVEHVNNYGSLADHFYRRT